MWRRNLSSKGASVYGDHDMLNGYRGCLRSMTTNLFLEQEDRSSALMVATYGSDHDVQDAYVTLRRRALDRAADLNTGPVVQVGSQLFRA